MSAVGTWMREILRTAARPLVDRGFRVRGCEAQRRHGSTLQRIYLQPDRHNQEDFGAFFVNVAINFDELRGLEPKDLDPVPDALDWTARLQRLVPGVPSSWELRRSTDRSALAARLGAALEGTLNLLESVRSPRDAVDNLPEMEGFELILRARLKYVSQDFDGALADLVRLHERFPDRVDLRDIVRRENLAELEARMATGPSKA